jgi:hypothetical protein
MTMRSNGWIAVGVMALAMTSAGAQQSGTSAPVKDDLFAGTEVFAKGASDVTEITMDPDTLGMVGGKASTRAHNMVLNVVRTYSYDKPGMYRMEDVEAFRNKLNTGDSTDVCNKRRSDDLVESAIITVEPKELTFIHTIRKRGAGESETMPMSMPLSMEFDPDMRANALVARAEMQADMAVMRANMAANSTLGGGLVIKMAPIDLEHLHMNEQQKLKLHVDVWNAEGPAAPLPPAAPEPPPAPAIPHL